MKSHIVNLDLPAAQRWAFLSDYQHQMHELLSYYLSDMEDASELFELARPYKDDIIDADFNEEIEFIASITDYSADDVLKANLYLDILKAYWGCTAFAFSHDNTVFHARNLDWWTENDMLSRYSMLFDFQREGKTLFKSIGWAGFLGVLSGIKPNAFTVTMNAVLSNDAPEIAMPIGFMLRKILTDAHTFSDAKHDIEHSNIASDALILLSGTQPEELAVIERTPTRFATRNAENGFIAVTNDYKILTGEQEMGDSPLQATSCGRFKYACELYQSQRPTSAEACLQILSHEKVMMGITVQQMVFENPNGHVIFRGG